MTKPLLWNFNGNLLSPNQVHISPENRSFRYGDGFFETILYAKEKLPLWEYHLRRIEQALTVFSLQWKHAFPLSALKEQLIALAQANNYATARLRLMFFRKNGGLYLPQSNEVRFLIAASPLEFSLAQNIFLGVSKQSVVSYSAHTPFKTNAALPYVLAAIEGQKEGKNEIILLNHTNKVADALYGNVWILNKNVWYCPPVNAGGVAGVMRAFLLENKENWYMLCREKPLRLGELYQADAIVLSNAVAGIKIVQQFEDKIFAPNEEVVFLQEKVAAYLYGDK
ncbi:MAG: aminotransferase class IV [Chitinophagales bacterium]|nr:aminotransferase class IV [Bacteroidota bacterium]MCB9043932.1 aminotransferase class IV [Chitinophagales bacterium]